LRSEATVSGVDGADRESRLNALVLKSRCEAFLTAEAQALDTWDLAGWLELLSPDIDYRIPVRNTLLQGQKEPSHSDVAFHMVDTFASLKVRLDRLSGPFGWSERPRSRARRHVSNIKVSERQDGVEVRSNLLLFWGRDEEDLLLSCQRHDILENVLGDFKLRRRRVLLDHDLFPLPSLSLPL
jgi:3-phenylpropionate/cinnamic acid dioxygenase small subunit